jgi:hypothetical protein
LTLPESFDTIHYAAQSRTKGDAMQRTPVQSSNIASVGFDDGVMEVEFTNGRVYRYVGVPSDIYQRVMFGLDDDASVGKRFNKLIRQGGFLYEEVEVSDEQAG